MVAEDRVLHRLLTSILMPRRMVAALTAVSACARDTTTRRVLVPLCVVLAVMAPTAAIAADRDGDGLRDSFETRWGVTNPDRRDSDRDGVIDSAEDNDHDRLGNLGEQRFGTDPGDRDTDDDGRSDGNEDDDRDGRTNAAEQDQRPLPVGLRPSLADAPDDASPINARCASRLGSAVLGRCLFGDQESTTSIVIIGDSHAMMFTPAFRRVATSEGWRVATLYKGGCPPVLGVRTLGQYVVDEGRSCAQWRRQAFRWLRDHPPDLVVVVHLDGYALVRRDGGRMTDRQRLETWRQGMRTTLTAMPLRSEVLVLGDTPKNREHPVRCLRRHPDDMSACVSRRTPPRRRLVEGTIRKVTIAHGAKHQRMYGKVCTYEPCPLVQGKVLMYRDRSHLTRTFAAQLTPSVRMLFREALRPG